MNPLVNVVRAFGTRGEAVQQDYQCRICGAAFDVQYHVCPRCSGFSVDPRIESRSDESSAGS